jgi:RNA polymerase sigma factor (sigma-70 family)
MKENQTWPLRPLTRRKKEDNSLYQREKKVEAEIVDLLALPLRMRRMRVFAGGAERLQEETLVWALRACWQSDSDEDKETAWEIAACLVERISGHINRKLARWRLSASDAEDCTRDLFAELFEVLFDTTEKAEFWEVRFWVCLDRRLWNLIEKRQAIADREESEADETLGETEGLEARLLRIADTNLGPEAQAEYKAALTVLNDTERQAVYLKYIEGLPEESEDPTRLTVAKILGVTGRSVRNYLRRAEKKLMEWEQQKI